MNTILDVFRERKIFCLIPAIILSVVAAAVIPAALEIKVFLGIMLLTFALWALEIFPLAYTGILVVVLLILAKILTLDEALKGFGSGTFLLLVSGFIMAKGINNTNLGKRVTFLILKKVGFSVQRLMLAVLLIPQILVLFIPSTGVRTVIMLPFVLSIITVVENNNEKNGSLAKVLILSLVFGCNLSGLFVLTGALANIVTVDFIYDSLGITISYAKWLILVLPIWLGSLCIVILIMQKFFTIKNTDFRADSLITTEISPGMDKREKKALFILTLVLILWSTQDLHGLHPSIPAAIGALLLTMPSVGVIDWNEAIKINWGTVLLIGSSLALGNAMQTCGADEFLAAKIINIPGMYSMLQIQGLAPFIIVFITIILHLGIASHVSNVIVVLPIVYEIGNALNLSSSDSLSLLAASGIASLVGFTFIVQSPPAVIAYGTGYLKARDLVVIGTLVSICMAILIGLTVNLWWPLIM